MLENIAGFIRRRLEFFFLFWPSFGFSSTVRGSGNKYTYYECTLLKSTTFLCTKLLNKLLMMFEYPKTV